MNYSHLYVNTYDVLEKARHSIVTVVKFVFVKIYLLTIIILQIGAFFQASNIYRRSLDNFLILHYNINFGIDLVGDAKKIFYFPLAGLFILLLNFILAAIFSHHKDARLLFHLFLVAALLFNIFLNLSLFAIYLINFQ